MGLTESTERRQASARQPRRASPGWTLGLTSLAYFMVALDALVVVTAVPAIDRELNASVSTLQWTINAYGLTWAAGIIAAAALGDLIGRVRMFVTGVALFTLASAGCALAANIGVLIAARAVQGLGAAIILPLSLTILVGVFPPERRGTVVGIWGGIGGLAIAAGPLVGGGLTSSLGWHWVFWINVPIGIVVAALSALRLVESRGPGRRVDVLGVVLITGGAVAFIWSLVGTGDLGWGAPRVITGFVVAVVLIGGFIAWERRASEPMLPLRLFRGVRFSAANATSFVMTAALLSAGVYVSQFLQFARGDSPLAAGVHFLPMMAMPLLVTPLAGVLSDKVGPRPLIVSGLIVEGIGLAWLSQTASTSTPYEELIVPLALTGIGLSMAMATTPAAALSAVPPADLGRASGVNGTLQRLGGAFGVAIATAVFAANGSLGTPARTIDGIRPALLVSASLALLGALTGLAVRRISAAAQG
jgi:EmrB/QacA subfamily drug resistance transporter